MTRNEPLNVRWNIPILSPLWVKARDAMAQWDGADRMKFRHYAAAGTAIGTLGIGVGTVAIVAGAQTHDNATKQSNGHTIVVDEERYSRGTARIESGVIILGAGAGLTATGIAAYSCVVAASPENTKKRNMRQVHGSISH
jgi:hypothetical protein